jgi:nitric oxide reductase large subunit
MQSSVNDSNYVFTADKYQNSTEKELKQSKEKIILNNTYYNQKDEIRPYTFFLLSVMNQDTGLDYNIKIDFEDSKDVNPSDDNNDDDDTTKIIIIVVIIIAVILILLGIILFNYVLKKKRNSSEIEKLSTEPSDNIVPSKFTE